MKKHILTSFQKYLKDKGFIENSTEKFDENDFSGVSDISAIRRFNPDIVAERKGIQYFYRFVDGSKEEHKTIAEKCTPLMNFEGRKPTKFRLLVPEQYCDYIIQSLNISRLERIGVIRLKQSFM
jgi:hypothetical protein